ncbi:MAG: peptidase M20, partial [Planctomycetaceae bacterium]
MVQIDEQRAIDRVMDLIAIPGGSGTESGVSKWISDQLRAAGVPESAIEIDRAHKRIPVGGDTGNLIVRLRGTRRGARRLLMAHMDTVPLAVGAKPVREGDWIRPASASTAL